MGSAFTRGAKDNGWESASGPEFKVRGPNYLKDKIKTTSEPSAFKLVGVHGFSAAERIPFVTDDTRLDTYRAGGEGDKNPFVFVFHFAIDPQHLVLVFELDEAAVSGSNASSGFALAWHRFLQGDDAYKSPRIKLITSMVEAKWVVRQAVGKPVPTLLGNKLACTFKQSDRMLECTCDVMSSFAARVILGVVRGACSSIVCDLMLLIEGTLPDELPERMLGGARVFRMNMPTFPPLDDNAKLCLTKGHKAPTEQDVQAVIDANAQADAESNRHSHSL